MHALLCMGKYMYIYMSIYLPTLDMRLHAVAFEMRYSWVHIPGTHDLSLCAQNTSQISAQTFRRSGF